MVSIPTTNADIIVPPNAYSVIAPMFSKNLALSRLYPASNMMGGKSTKKKTSGLNEKSVKSVTAKRATPPINMPTRIATPDSGRK
jgi:hypothetical protein